MTDPLVVELSNDYNEAKRHLSEMIQTVIWMSGSPSFDKDGPGGEHWASEARPKLFEAMDFLEKHGVER